MGLHILRACGEWEKGKEDMGQVVQGEGRKEKRTIKPVRDKDRWRTVWEEMKERDMSINVLVFTEKGDLDV